MPDPLDYWLPPDGANEWIESQREFLAQKTRDAGNWSPTQIADVARSRKSYEHWSRQRQDKLRLHAYTCGMHAGLQGAHYMNDCPYRQTTYKRWWTNGCICGNADRGRKRLARELVRVQAELDDLKVTAEVLCTIIKNHDA